MSLSADPLARAFPGEWEGDGECGEFTVVAGLLVAGSVIGAAALVAAGFGVVRLALWPYQRMVDRRIASQDELVDWLASLW